MKTACEQTTWTRYTVEKYVDTFGPKLDEKARERTRPTIICPACREPMHTVGENGPLRDAVWAHNPPRADWQPRWCPMKDLAGVRYQLLRPVRPDLTAAAALREAFFLNWELHWAHITKIVPMADILTFIEFIRRADQIDFWQQRGLQEWFIPYIFLSLCDFPPPKSKKGALVRPEWVRCRFDNRIRDMEDLWIKTEGDWGFIRAFYRVPTRGQPGPSHLIDVAYVPPDNTFLTHVRPGANAFQKDRMRAAFPGEVT